MLQVASRMVMVPGWTISQYNMLYTKSSRDEKQGLAEVLDEFLLLSFEQR